MLEVLRSGAAFVVAIGLLVALHEYGHFWVARRLGVRVLRFSIGFGRPLWRHRGADGVEYVLSAIPLGGYVKMLDEREGEVPADQLDQAFNRAPVGHRMAIAAAGPAANFLFAIVAYWCVFVMGQTGLMTRIAPPADGTLAQAAGLVGGEQIVRFDGEEVQVWDQLRPKLLEAALGQLPVTVVGRGTHGDELTYVLDFEGVSLEPDQVFKTVGLDPLTPALAPIIGGVEPGSPAALAGLREGDRIMAADGQPQSSWMQWRETVRKHPGAPLRVEVLRAGESLALTLQPEAVAEGEITVGRIGAAVAAQPELWHDLEVEWRLSPLAAIPAALDSTWRMTALTVRMLVRMVVGDVSVRNVSGPIHIAQYAGSTAAAGVVAFVSFLAVISVSLGVLNLLPVPVLDGGHLLYDAIELIKGSPLSLRAQALGQQLGMAMLLLLMGIAFFNDIARLMG